MPIEFVKLTSESPVVEYLAKTLSAHLSKGERVLWLVPGGSAIKVAVKVAHKLAKQPLGKLTVSLTDERYGEVGHADSNWRGLEAAGFKLKGATLQPVLNCQDRAATVVRFAELLDRALDEAEFSLGFFGIGPDGHTAGILPHSPDMSPSEAAAWYDNGLAQRVSMTPSAIRRLNEAVVYAVGEAKRPVLEDLADEVELDTQPAQALKQAGKLTVYNDYKGETS